MEETIKLFFEEYSKKDMNEIIEDVMMYSNKLHSLSTELKRHQDTYDNEKLVQEYNTGQNIAIATLEGKISDKEEDIVKKKEDLTSSKEQLQSKLLSELDQQEEEEIQRIRQKYEKKRAEVPDVATIKSTNSIRSLECAEKQLVELKRKMEILKKIELDKLEKRLPKPVIIAKHKIESLQKELIVVNAKLDVLRTIHSKRAIKLF